MRVLVVEDDSVIAESIVFALSSPSGRMATTVVDDGRHAELMLADARRELAPFDAVVLDLTLPGMDGLDVLRRMRAAGDITPVLVLTARVTLADRVEGLETGADDYLAKPFEPEELIARLRALDRRNRPVAAANERVFGNLTFNAGTGSIKVNEATVVLSARQHAILLAMLRRSVGTLVPKDFLANMDDEGSSPGSIDTQMSRLRAKLNAAGAGIEIRTVHGQGYILELSAA